MKEPLQAYAPRNVIPLDALLHGSDQLIARLKTTGRPELVQVDADTNLVVMSVRAFQALQDELDRLAAREGDGHSDREPTNP